MTKEFRFVTEWQITAPLTEVCNAITHCLDWPLWWEGVEEVKQLSAGDHNGIGSVHHFVWKGRIPYRFSFDMLVTNYTPLVFLEGQASGEIIGTGRWDFSRRDDATIVRYQWQVRTNRLWMNLIAPIAAPIFRWNHHQVMKQGASGIANLLNADLKYVCTLTL